MSMQDEHYWARFKRRPQMSHLFHFRGSKISACGLKIAGENIAAELITGVEGGDRPTCRRCTKVAERCGLPAAGLVQITSTSLGAALSALAPVPGAGQESRDIPCDENGQPIPKGFTRSSGEARCPVDPAQTIELFLVNMDDSTDRFSIRAGECGWEHQSFTYRIVDGPPSHRMEGNRLVPSGASSETETTKHQPGLRPQSSPCPGEEI